MTNEHAILLLEAYKSNLTSSCSNQLDGDIEAFDMAIKSLRNERPKGEWKIQPHSMIMRCSLCGHEETAKDVGAINPDKHFCSSCGAEMQTKEDNPCPCIDCIFKSTNSKKDCTYCEAWYKWSLE